MNDNASDRIPHISAAELVTKREFLGLTGDWLATSIGTSPRTLRRWEAGDFTIPDDAHDFIDRLEADADRVVADLIAELTSLPEPGLVLLRTDAEYRLQAFARPYPARWHRQIAARTTLKVPNLKLAYADEHLGRGTDWMILIGGITEKRIRRYRSAPATATASR